MTEPSPSGQRSFALHLAATELRVAPGQSLSIPILVYNEGREDQDLTLSVRGVPTPWLSLPSPLVHLAPGEQREVRLTVQPPAFPQGRASRHSLVIRVANQHAPSEAVEKACTLTVAALEVQGRIGLLLPATRFSVAPGGSVAIPLVLLNQGLDADTFALAVDGIPSAWVFAPTAAVSLAPGQQQEVTLTVQPPASAQSGAGRHPFRILVSSQAMPGQVAEAACILTIAAATRFAAQLRPQSAEAGQPARITIENQGNIQQVFTVGWQSPDGEVVFEPPEAQSVRIPPGEVGLVEFVAQPRSRPLLGGEFSRPFTLRVQAPDQQTRNLSGEVVSRALLPGWVLPAVGIAILALIAAAILIAILGGSGGDVSPTQVPATEAPPAAETAVPPTEVPPEAPPTEALPPTEVPPPTEEPAPTEAPPPTEAPALTEAPPPTEGPAPTQEPPGEGGLPCLPAAPLLVTGRAGRKG